LKRFAYLVVEDMGKLVGEDAAGKLEGRGLHVPCDRPGNRTAPGVGERGQLLCNASVAGPVKLMRGGSAMPLR
jgi:hypothetical protein